jgi:hypothetical protein
MYAKTQSKPKPGCSYCRSLGKPESEEDEEAFIMRRRNERQAIQDAKDEQLIKIARAKKMRKDITPLRDEAIAIKKAKLTDIMKQIKALETEYVKGEEEIALITSGGMDEELIKQKTEKVVITPTEKLVITPTARPSSTPKPDGARARNTKDRPSDIYPLFSKPTLIKIKMSDKDYYGKVMPDQKLIKACKEDGTFNHTTDKGVISHLTKTIIIKGENGEKDKQKDVPDETEPAKERTEWAKKDDWIKACKGEQNLYSSTKNGWKEISFKNDKGEWIGLLDTAFEGAKLN